MFSPTWCLLQQEGYLAQSCLCNGLTALRQANIGNKKGLYYSAFFELSNGFERLMKLILIIDFIANNALNLPTGDSIEKYGHKLNKLLEAITLAIQHANPSLGDSLKKQKLSIQLLSFLDKYAHPSGRYANINKLLGNKYQDVQDPLFAWDMLAQEIFEDEATRSEKDRARKMGEIATTMLGDSAISLIGDLNQRILNPQDVHMKASVLETASKHAIFALIGLIEILRDILGCVTDVVHKIEQQLGNNQLSVPFMKEFFDFAWADRRVVMRKKRWP